MALAQITDTAYHRPAETYTATLMAGAITNGDFDVLTLPPGLYRIYLMVHANGVSAGTIACVPLIYDGTGAVTASEENYIGITTGGVASFTTSLIDQVGPVAVAGGPSTNLMGIPIAITAGIRFTVAAIAGAGPTNRIDFVASRC